MSFGYDLGRRTRDELARVENGTLSAPHGIAVDSRGDVYVSGEWGYRTWPEGAKIRATAGSTNKVRQFGHMLPAYTSG